MAHVTFIHGIGNKPKAEDLLRDWRVALFDGDGLDLDAPGVTSSMVYWADMLYESPVPAGTAHESSRQDGLVRVEDVGVSNTGSWRYSIGRYLGQPHLRDFMREVLG